MCIGLHLPGGCRYSCNIHTTPWHAELMHKPSNSPVINLQWFAECPVGRLGYDCSGMPYPSAHCHPCCVVLSADVVLSAKPTAWHLAFQERHCVQVKLVDAGFIWTEPHSRRLKTKLTVQSEVFNGAILQQTFVVEYVVETHMCPDCSKAAANPNTWTAVVQVRHPTVLPAASPIASLRGHLHCGQTECLSSSGLWLFLAHVHARRVCTPVILSVT